MYTVIIVLILVCAMWPILKAMNHYNLERRRKQARENYKNGNTLKAIKGGKA